MLSVLRRYISILLLTITVACGSKNDSTSKVEHEGDPDDTTLVTVKSSKKNLLIDSVFCYFDLTYSMRGFVNDKSSFNKTLGDIETVSKQKNWTPVYLAYGKLKNGIDTVSEISLTNEQSIHTVLKPAMFNRISNDYNVAFKEAVSRLKKNRNSVQVVITDGIPTNSVKEANWLSVAKQEFRSTISSLTKNDSLNAVILVSNTYFDGNYFDVAGKAHKINQVRPLISILLYYGTDGTLDLMADLKGKFGIDEYYAFQSQPKDPFSMVQLTKSGNFKDALKNEEEPKILFEAKLKSKGVSKESIKFGSFKLLKREIGTKTEWKPVLIREDEFLIEPSKSDSNKVKIKIILKRLGVEYLKNKEFKVQYINQDRRFLSSLNISSAGGVLSLDEELKGVRDVDVLFDGIIDLFSSSPTATLQFKFQE